MKKNFVHQWLFIAFLSLVNKTHGQQTPLPSERQLAWQSQETTAFLHFTVNTFTDKEWGDGTESPSIFNPEKLDARQWIKALKEAGFKMAIITAKHHDGFCLWPSGYTEHSVKNSPWKNGKGDVVKEVADACREYGIRFGFYLSPWDMHEVTYGTSAYNRYYRNQLMELLTHYGKVSEVWFDGAKGENAKSMEYEFESYWAMVRKYQPEAVIFSDIGPDVRWVGNEKGIAGETCWSTITTDSMEIGAADTKYLNTGDPVGKYWIPAETDVSIRKGWFWHQNENDSVRSPQNLVNLYYQSVGRNSMLLLNIPPNNKGLLEEQDIRSIKAFRVILNQTFRTNLSKGKVLPSLTDGQLKTYTQITPDKPLLIDLKNNITFDRVMLQEHIMNGQQIENGRMEYWDRGTWKDLASFTTIGYKKLIRTPIITTSRVRLYLNGIRGRSSQLSEIGFYKASPDE